MAWSGTESTEPRVWFSFDKSGWESARQSSRVRSSTPLKSNAIATLSMPTTASLTKFSGRDDSVPTYFLSLLRERRTTSLSQTSSDPVTLTGRAPPPTIFGAGNEGEGLPRVRRQRLDRLPSSRMKAAPAPASTRIPSGGPPQRLCVLDSVRVRSAAAQGTVYRATVETEKASRESYELRRRATEGCMDANAPLRILLPSRLKPPKSFRCSGQDVGGLLASVH